MSTLSSFWHGAAQLSGRIDFSGAVLAHRGEIEGLDTAALIALGVPRTRATSLTQASPLSTEFASITLDSSQYPDILAALPYAPPVLFLTGNIGLLSCAPRVAVVGSRRCTDDGRRMARELAHGIADAGGVVISGLAHGIDTAAHLSAPDRTVAVLGRGLGRPLGGTRRRVATTILDAGGLLVSEFLPDRPASKWTFPQRNRIIAGLAQATVVVEAAQKSGARITARHALDAGREVLAVPGSPYAPSSAGCLSLLADGAGLVRHVDDVLDCVGLTRQTPDESSHPIIKAMHNQSVRFDELLTRCALTPATLMRTLSMLELTGRIERLPGDLYTVKR